MHFDGDFIVVVWWLFLFLKRLRINARIRAREVKIAPSRFARSVCEISSGLVLGRMEEMDMPAALTRMSMDS